MCDANLTVSNEMRDKIREVIRDIEKKENITVIYCAEAGSRAWGMPSSDSDYDVRFIFMRRPETYLSFVKYPDSIDYHDGCIDAHGIDIKEAIHLIYISEPSIYEWDYSPTQYKSKSEWKEIQAFLQKHFDAKSMASRYFGMAKTVFYKDIYGNLDIKNKKYLYCIRHLLCCEYVIEYKEPCPLTMQYLISLYVPESIATALATYTVMKTGQSDLSVADRNYDLDKYIINKLGCLEKKMFDLPSEHEKSTEPYTKLLMNIFLLEMQKLDMLPNH